ncbi:MAG: hypothetical protein DLM70_15150 [Chloroflexi bacterium]|nr:MAG: hypothetical protein DLM70_15150 [Chloroflexota bacterium]
MVHLPGWLDFASDESAAAAMYRGLPGRSADWGELVSFSQTIMGYFQDSFGEDEARALYDEQNALPLIAASRILDAASRPRSGLPADQLADLALVSAVSYAMYGNLPSASAVLSRSVLEMLPISPGTAVILATCAPRLLGAMLRRTEHPSPQRKYLETLSRLLQTGDDRAIQEVRQLYDQTLFAEQPPFEGALLRPCRLVLQHILNLSTAIIFRQADLEFPETHVLRLISQVPLLLPPQRRALID